MNRYLDLVDPWTRPSRAEVDDLWDIACLQRQVPFRLEKSGDLNAPSSSTVVVAASILSCQVVQVLVEKGNESFLWATIFREDMEVFKLYLSKIEGVGFVLLGFLVDFSESYDLHSIGCLLVDSFLIGRWIVLDSMPGYKMGIVPEENNITRYCLSSQSKQDSSLHPLLSYILEAPAALTGLSAALMTRLEIGKQYGCAIVVSENQLDNSEPSVFALLVALQLLIPFDCSVEYIENVILPQVENKHRRYKAKRDSLYL
ncbi:hypothetical protein Gasu2_26400 [Galdieria sulphuraria]|uniref:Uncharacterized protein n=1 Tax=Galdieria sulphuraria TaxID=130081 RepID=M2XZ68_GALSU|nr:uncharacterized protein Gasu_36770 [Galdieria sulphuraria]EME28943.1 hypothetical protein Gasu_36770 [Galdieria sulphuraria]GJD08331.1 hypothetical protein Gasu2_26400 [Galdieria sulphuraria]|eukprot:XP_005705463.1 hypothetical protein Gasu_36770 [Galdieria sulphuraria]